MSDRHITERLSSYPRRGTVVDQIVIHESVTSSRRSTLAVLRARKPVPLSVHYIVDRDGSVTQHAPLEEACVHAGKLNGRSVAIEVVNRYYGRHADERADRVIDAVWAHRGRYIVPPLAQCEAVWVVVEDILGHVATIPSAFPGVGPRGFIWGRLPWLQRLRVPPGILAHHRTAHADGLFLEHYCWQRSHDRSPASSWRRTVEAASSGLKVTQDMGWVG